ncbi:RNA 2',3'-cyclic phosphodiesterase [Sinimarinibacterium sp. CAU 1509]|uniref:RNA 2',3'-cyclic phosphodiesterase n=1 Tax=Sinimarinibacterium sp. CAU 1509 TaxID=2562283 RepID=UPI0010AB701B|nr:RNA 2',3'-cyclic phosphodiesterase [Sinimarinibacterium sp. CAU 1509]TJY56636.1 RNA 2',3'-cyclic phosphodiesterase [Sinimarinibacterium sp. CAU 1509]
MHLNRLFFALWPDDAVRSAAADVARGVRIRMSPGGHPTPVEQYHVTVLFLGSALSDAQEAAARQAASRIKVPPFEWVLDHAGSFRAGRRVPWWLGAHAEPPELRLLHERLRQAMQAVGISLERGRFVPHLTIQRGAEQLLPKTAIAPIRWKADEFVLVRSHLDREPGGYEIIARWALDGAPDAEREPPDQLSLW